MTRALLASAGALAIFLPVAAMADDYDLDALRAATEK